MSTTKQLLALALLPAMLTACSSDDPTPDTTSTLIWSSCSTESTLECATLKVPSAYNAQSSEKIDIAINRLGATDQPAKGVLLLNPGGPGSPGLELLESIESASFPETIRASFDLIGFDPRGIGQSTPVDCSEFGIDSTDQYVLNQSEIEFLVNQTSSIADKCFEKYGNYLQQLGSLNVVRDMDEIRKALNQDTINFIGYSYGTRLAALYLQHFPENSGAIVLDGSVRTDSAVIPLVEGSLIPLEQNLLTILSQCSEPTCNPDELIQQLAANLNNLSSLEDQGDFDLLGGLVQTGATNPEFGTLLAAPLIDYLQNGDLSVLRQFLAFIEQLTGPIDDDSDSFTTLIAVVCADDAYRPTADELQSILERFNEQSDVFAEASLSLAASCTGWPEAVDPLPEITTNTAPISLIIGGVTDAQTPLLWSEEMAGAIGGVYLRSSHSGHTVVFNEKSECIDTVVEDFLLNSLTPDEDACIEIENE